MRGKYGCGGRRPKKRIIKVISEMPLTQMQILSKMCLDENWSSCECPFEVLGRASGRGTPDNKQPLLASPHSKFLEPTEKSPRRWFVCKHRTPTPFGREGVLCLTAFPVGISLFTNLTATHSRGIKQVKRITLFSYWSRLGFICKQKGSCQ